MIDHAAQRSGDGDGDEWVDELREEPGERAAGSEERVGAHAGDTRAGLLAAKAPAPLDPDHQARGDPAPSWRVSGVMRKFASSRQA